MSKSPQSLNVKNSIEISIRIILLFLIIAWCLVLLVPFLEPVLWGVIIAVSVSPVFVSLNKKLGDKPKLTSTLIVLVFLAVIIVPFYLVISSSADKMIELSESIDKSDLKIPPPDASVADWPLVGEKVFKIWSGFSSNLEKSLNNYNGYIAKAGKAVVGSIVGLAGSVFMFIISIIIAGILLATNGTRELMNKFFIKSVGEKGLEFSHLSEKTIRGVTKGVIGTAFIQAIILGILFALAGVPYAGIWGILCLILGIMQLPPSLISIPVVFYIFSVNDAGMATVWAILIIAAGFIDNVLKPILLGKGSSVPMLVIFLGSIGGFMATGFLGLFTGAIVLSLGYELFILWINSDQETVTVKQKLN